MTALSAGELAFYRESLKRDCRCDGRDLCDVRPFSIEQGSLLFPNALYSASISIPDSKTSILIGINANIVPKGENTDPEDYFKLEIELAHQRSARDDAERFSQTTIAEIEDLLKKLFVSKLDFSVLLLFEGKLHWAIECSVFVIGDLQANDIDYVFKGLKTAVSNCRFPKVNVSFNNWTDEFSYEVTGEEVALFGQMNLPTALVIGEIEGRLVLDLTAQELQAVDSYYIVALDSKGTVTDIEKMDGSAVSINRLGNVISLLMNMRQLLIK